MLCVPLMSPKQVSVFVVAVIVFLALLLPNYLQFIAEAEVLTSGGVAGRARFGSTFLVLDSILVVFLWCVVLLALVRKFYWWFILNLPFYVLLPYECLYFLAYGEPISPHIIAIAAETNLEEVLGFIGGWLPIILSCVYFLGLIALILFFARERVAWTHRSRWWVLFSFGPALVLMGLSDSASNQAILEDHRDVFIERGVGFGVDQYEASYPLGFPLRLIKYFHQQEVLTHYSKLISGQSSGLKRGNMEGAEVYVVMIGESSRPDHWGVAGYHRNTTPLLQARSDIYFFENMVSGSSVSRAAVPILLSRTSARDVEKSTLRNSWIVDFKQAGFRVYWLSTQKPVGSHDTMIGVYASLADEVRYLNEGTYSGRGKFDEVLVGGLSSVVQDQTVKKKLVILHSLGSHAPYQFRYPEHFAYFQPSPTTAKLISLFDGNQKELLVNAYDNSIAYTDYVIDSVLDLLKSELNESDAFFWYIADHGQTLFEPGCDKAGHGFFSEFNFRVPALFWASDKFLSSRPELHMRASMRQHAPMQSSDFFETMLDLGRYEQEEKLNGLLSEDYQVGRRLVTVSGAREVDFDSELMGRGCDFPK
nr:phosphoethanolamine transferase [Microbulbifer elongatus]